ncbi:MAG: DAK2 domain-containing protein [Dehalococcoidia bacterium]|nr:DAK2 domain-containing protein [Dehalococcoidia bacterium]
MAIVNSYNGQDLRNMLAAATEWLKKSAGDIDALNVFPVPDGDTGTNMMLTMSSTIEEIARSSDLRLGAISQSIAHGSLMGARGNSGVILSQILRGLAQGLSGKETFDSLSFVSGLEEGAKFAYKSMSRPVEGTMLTVIRETAIAARDALRSDHQGLIDVLNAAVRAARESVARTPTLLPILRQVGVVDAGGQGIYVLLEGILRYLQGEITLKDGEKAQIILPSAALETGKEATIAVEVEPEKPYGYCTEFLIHGQGLSIDKIRERLEAKGESLMVVGDHNTLKVHIHTYKPGIVLNLATRLGTLHEIQIHNMDDQYREYKEKLKARDQEQGEPSVFAPTVPIAIIAVVSGEGLVKVFQSLGIAAIVHGGDTMNPSVQQLAQAIESVPSDNVILLPNNKNIIPAANQVQSLTRKQVVVVPTATIPQGISAVLAFNPEADIQANSEAMQEAQVSVKTVALTYAVRPSECCGQRIEQGQAIGLVDEELVAWDDSLSNALVKSLGFLNIAKAETITIYSGEGVSAVARLPIESILRQQAPEAQVETVEGGQPHYPFIISIE